MQRFFELPGGSGPWRLEACESVGHPCDIRMRAGYDHSDYFIASFIGEHIAHHAGALRG